MQRPNHSEDQVVITQIVDIVQSFHADLRQFHPDYPSTMFWIDTQSLQLKIWIQLVRQLTLNRSSFPFCIIIAEPNIQRIKSLCLHPVLQPLIEAQVVDFISCSRLNNQSLQTCPLIYARKCLPVPLQRPIVVIAYQKYQNTLATIFPSTKELSQHLQRFLRGYQKMFPTESSIQLTIPALQSIAALASISPESPLLYLSASNAYTTLGEAQAYGSISPSFVLNEHAVSIYAKLRGGIVLARPSRNFALNHDQVVNSLTCVVFTNSRKRFVRTIGAYFLTIDEVNGQDLHAIVDGLDRNSKNCRVIITKEQHEESIQSSELEGNYNKRFSADATIPHLFENIFDQEIPQPEGDGAAAEIEVLTAICRLCSRDPDLVMFLEPVRLLLESNKGRYRDEVEDLVQEFRAIVAENSYKPASQEVEMYLQQLEETLHTTEEEFVLAETRENDVVFERNIKFSDSKLWSLSRDYYDEKGTFAWGDEGVVPNFITVNTYIARTYSKLILATLIDRFAPQDSICQMFTTEDPLYLIDLGAGTGKFGFLLLTEMTGLIHEIAATLKDFCCCKNCPKERCLPKFKYILTDFTASNVNWWRSQKQLRAFVQSGLLDFAIFDAENDVHLHLLEADEILHFDGKTKRNAVVIANYLFDSLSCDVFRIEEGQLLEGQMTNSIDLSPFELTQETQSCLECSDNPLKMLLSIDTLKSNFIESISTSFNFVPVNGSKYYESQPIWNRILQYYVTTFPEENQTILFPFGAMKCVANFQKFVSCAGELVILTSDKGMVDFKQIQRTMRCKQPYIDKHGSISVTMNFHALELFLQFQQEHQHWASHTTSHSIVHHIQSCVYQLGGQRNADDSMLGLVYGRVQAFSPDDFFRLCHSIVEDGAASMSLAEVLAMIKLSCYDPDIFFKYRNEFRRGIGAQIQDATLMQLHTIIHTIKQISRRVYQIHDNDDICFELARIAIVCGQYHLGLALLDRSNALMNECEQDSITDTMDKARRCTQEWYQSDRTLVQQHARAMGLYFRGFCYLQLNMVEEMNSAFDKCISSESDFADSVEFLKHLYIKRTCASAD